MRRSPYILGSAALVGAFVAALTVGAAVSGSDVADATAVQYTVTRTVGPYSGALPVGATVPCSPANAAGAPLGCVQTAPGALPGDSESFDVWCHNNRDAMLSGSAVINTKTPGHPDAKQATVALDRIGAHYDPDADISMRWGTFVRPNGRPGWSSVTITATCLVRR
jgi:hypothetical protein